MNAVLPARRPPRQHGGRDGREPHGRRQADVLAVRRRALRDGRRADGQALHRPAAGARRRAVQFWLAFARANDTGPFPFRANALDHIFRSDSSGHFGQDENTAENQQLIRDATADPANYQGTDETLRKMSNDFSRPLMTMVLDKSSLSELGANERHRARILLVAMRVVVFLGWLFTVAVPSLLVR